MPDAPALIDGEVISLDSVPDRHGRWRLVAQVHVRGAIVPMLLVGPTTGDGGRLQLAPTDEFELVAQDVAGVQPGGPLGAVTGTPPTQNHPGVPPTGQNLAPGAPGTAVPEPGQAGTLTTGEVPGRGKR